MPENGADPRAPLARRSWHPGCSPDRMVARVASVASGRRIRVASLAERRVYLKSWLWSGTCRSLGDEEEGQNMRTRYACAAALALGALAMLPAGEAAASSHREAPFITKMPKVDNTDFYAFRSYENGRAAFVTIIANFQPLQDPYGGPNYFSLDPEALYEIHIDNTGDGKEDITFQFQFDNALNGANGVTLPIGTGAAKKDVAIPFINANLGTNNQPPAITAANQAGFRNVNETYTVKMVKGARRAAAGVDVTHTGGPGPNATTFIKPLDFIGLKSFGANNPATVGGPYTAYNDYANAHVYTNVTLPGCATPAKVFVGQRHEHFAVNLGAIFDLVNANAGQLTDPNGGTGGNTIGDKNVTSIAMELPIACIKGAAPADQVIGTWSTASVRQARVINPQATYVKPSREGGAWAQVSRLGMPLVNEVVIGLKDKDRFNSSEPANDAANFADYVTHPTLPAVLEALFGPTVQAPKKFPRQDLVAAFLTGVPGVNAFPGAANPPSEMVRLNIGAIPPTPVANQNRLGAALCFVDDPAAAAVLRKVDTTNPGCDPAGFPNGRRPGDDVVDIALRVAMGYLFTKDADAPSRNVGLGDFVPQGPTGFAAFPYLDGPFPGTNTAN